MQTLTVGAMSKPSSERPRAPAPSCSSGRNSATCSGENSVGIQPSAISPASARVVRADRGEVDRDLLLHRRDRELQRLAGAVGQRQRQRLALELQPLARERLAHDRDVLARALDLARRSAGRASPRRPAGPEEPMPEQHPPARELVDRRRGHRGHRRAAGGHLEDRRAELDRRRQPGEPAEDRRGVRAVGLGGPDRVIAEPLGLLDDLALVVGGESEAPVADVDAELHAAARSFQDEEFGCRGRRAAIRWPCPERTETEPYANASRTSRDGPSTLYRRLPERTRKAMLIGLGNNTVITGAFSGLQRGLPDAGGAPRGRPHELHARSPRHGTVHRRPRALHHSVRQLSTRSLILRAEIEASLEPPRTTELAEAIAEHQATVEARRRRDRYAAGPVVDLGGAIDEHKETARSRRSREADRPRAGLAVRGDARAARRLRRAGRRV